MQQQTEREVFGNGRWIWTEAHPGPDDYAEFYAEFRPQAPAAPAQAGPGPAAGAGAGATGTAGTSAVNGTGTVRAAADASGRTDSVSGAELPGRAGEGGE